MNRHTRKISAISIAFALVLVLGALGAIGVHGQEDAPLRTLDAKQPITYFIAEGNAQSGYRPSDRQLALWALQAWQRNAAGRFRFVPGPEATALVRVNWAEPNGTEYGEMQPLIVGVRRGAAVYIRPDVQSLGPDISPLAEKDDLLRESIVYLTCLHELGHALGLPHTRDFRDIMYYFGFGGDIVEYFNRYRVQLHTREDIAMVSGLSASDVAHIRAAYPPAPTK